MPTTATPLSPAWLEESDWPLCTAVYVGCVAGQRMSGCHAHAHSRAGDPNIGAICFSPDRLAENWSGYGPSAVFIHEYAHLQTGNADDGTGRRHHGPTWRANLNRLHAAFGLPKVRSRFSRSVPGIRDASGRAKALFPVATPADESKPRKAKRRPATRDVKTGRFMTQAQMAERGPCHCGGPRDDETKRTCSKCRARAAAFGKRRTEAKRAAKARKESEAA